MNALSAKGVIASAALAATVVGCGTMADPNPSLDAAHASYRALQADPQANLLAAAELTQAGEALRAADTAWTQHDGARTVDHLTYLARQRVAIARETTAAMTWEQAAAATRTATDADKARADRDRARTDIAAARQNTEEKSVELAVVTAVWRSCSRTRTARPPGAEVRARLPEGAAGPFHA